MATEVFARVVFQSPLPALNREFEYRVGSEIRNVVAVGQRVRVPFAGQAKEGFIVGLSDTASFVGKLSELGEIVSSVSVLTEHIYLLLKAIAERQCSSVGEILGNAIPKRSVRVEKSFELEMPVRKVSPLPTRFAELVSPVADVETGRPIFLRRLAVLSHEYFAGGRSVIVCVPDFRDLERLKQALADLIPNESISIVDSNDLASDRYRNFLSQLSREPLVVLGTRNAIYSPVAGDAAIIIWDDGDQSHQDQQAPYLTTREIALLRSSLFDAPLHFLSHSRSTEVQRLVGIGYLEDAKHSAWHPKVALSEGAGLDGMTFKLIKRALESGPVLVQVAAPGNARSLYCAACNSRSRCNHCNGPLWLNAKGQIVCRWCGQLNLNFSCVQCKNTKLKQGAAGASRWAEQLGKSFPGIAVREITAEQQSHLIPSRPALVICTPGIEPIANGGYSGVVLLDCASQLNVDSLRAPEDALRSWLNAIAFMRPDAEAVAVGASPEVNRALSLGQITETVSNFLKEREELGFPPSKRILSATGSREVVDELAKLLAGVSQARVLGISESRGVTAEIEYRLVASFNYADGASVASLVRDYVAGLSSKQVRTNLKSGKNLRPLTIKFDDPKVT